jgi:hypothetical protein
VNQRTKESTFYRVNGATEESAKGAAQDLVSAYKWRATFPLLINVSGEPTYFLSLKGDTEVVQGYAMVNVREYNSIKVMGKSLAECTEQYVATLRSKGIEAEQPVVPDTTPDDDETKYGSVEGVVSDVRSLVSNGNTIYYVQLEEDSAVYYRVTVNQEAAALLNKGDRVQIEYAIGVASILDAVEISRVISGAVNP